MSGWGASRSKYGNHKVVTDDGTFDSEKEYRRYRELKILEAIGQVSDIKRQVEYELIPNQRDEHGKLIERKVTYKADFVYKDETGSEIVEDVKGFKTKEYILKRKMMLNKYGIRIMEV